MPGVQLDQLDLLVLATCQTQVVDGLRVNGEHRRRRAVFRRHVGDRRPVAQGQTRRTCAVKLQVGADHLLLAQVLGQREHQVGGGDAWLMAPGQFDADDVRQAHPRGAPEHDVLGLEPTDANGNHTQGVDMWRMAVRAHQCVGKGYAVEHLHHR